MQDIFKNEDDRKKIDKVLTIKVEEFARLGYDSVGQEDIWSYIERHYMNTDDTYSIKLHQLVNDILSLSITEYMNRLQLNSLQGPDWFTTDEPLNLFTTQSHTF